MDPVSPTFSSSNPLVQHSIPWVATLLILSLFYLFCLFSCIFFFSHFFFFLFRQDDRNKKKKTSRVCTIIPTRMTRSVLASVRYWACLLYVTRALVTNPLQPARSSSENYLERKERRRALNRKTRAVHTKGDDNAHTSTLVWFLFFSSPSSFFFPFLFSPCSGDVLVVLLLLFGYNSRTDFLPLCICVSVRWERVISLPWKKGKSAPESAGCWATEEGNPIKAAARIDRPTSLTRRRLVWRGGNEVESDNAQRKRKLILCTSEKVSKFNTHHKKKWRRKSQALRPSSS